KRFVHALRQADVGTRWAVPVRERISSKSIPVGRAEWEEWAIGPSILDTARHLGQREQPGTQGGKPRADGADRLAPVGLEKAWCGGAGRQADVRGQAVDTEPGLQPVISLSQPRLARCDLRRVGFVAHS